MNHSVKSSLLSLQNDIHVIFETVVLLSNVVSKTRRVGHKRCIGFPNKKANYGQQASIACQTRGQGGWSELLKPIVMVEEYKVRLTSIHFYQKTKVRVPLCQVGKSYQSGHKVIDGGFFPSIQNLRGEHRVMHERCNLLFPSFRKVCIYRLRLFIDIL